MPLFRYKAVTETGKTSVGVIDADSLVLAKERLRRQQVLVTDLRPVEKDKGEITLPPALLIAFTRDVGQLLRAGLPLYESLLTIEEKYRKHKSHPLFLDLCDALKGGASLSDILRKYPKTFDPVYLSMVTAAEQTGSLPQVFEELTQLVSRQQKLKKQIVGALAYPAFLGVFCVLVILSLLFFVIPSLAELFQGKRLHPLTEFVLGVSSWANAHTVIFLSTPPILVLAIFFLMQKNQVRILLQRLCLNVPFFNTVIVESVMIRFCRALSALLSGGVPLIEALSLSRKVMRHLLFEQVIANAEERIVEGARFSEQLRKSPLMPGLFVRMVSIAEETGKMAPMLLSIAEIYDEDLERNLLQFTTYLQPVMLLIMGGIIGLVLLSVLLPLTDVSSFMSG